MRRASAYWTRPEQRPPPATAFAQGGGGGGGGSSRAGRPSGRKPGPGAPWSLLLALIAFGASSCKGVPVASHVLQGEKVWNEMDDKCSAYLARDTLPQLSNALEEFCFMVLEFLQKDKELVERDNIKKEELRIPGGVQSRGYFMFRPRNGRRSATFN